MPSRTAAPPSRLRICSAFSSGFTARTARARNTGGYGLGLSIAQSIADGHHAGLSVKSADPVGTTFTIQIAACQGAITAPQGR